MADIMQVLVNVFGPAAVTLVLLIVAIQKMWPQLILNQTQTREINTELIEALRQLSKENVEVANRWLRVFDQLHDDTTRELVRLSDDHMRFEKQMSQRHDEQMQALESINRALQGVANSLNGG